MRSFSTRRNGCGQRQCLWSCLRHKTRKIIKQLFFGVKWLWAVHAWADASAGVYTGVYALIMGSAPVFVVMPAPGFVAAPAPGFALAPVCSTAPLKALPPSHQCATTAYRQPLCPLTTAH